MQNAAIHDNLGKITADYKQALSSASIPPSQREELQGMYETRIADLQRHGNELETELNKIKEKERE